MLDKLVSLCICSQHMDVSPSLMAFPHTDENIQAVREVCSVLREEVIIFSWSHGLSPVKET